MNNNGKDLHLRSEYCDLGDLNRYLQSNHLEEVVKYELINQIINGMKTIYENNVIHGDIKLEHILLKSGGGANGGIIAKIGGFS